MKTSVLNLLEAPPVSLQFEGAIVSLRPQVSYRLQDAGIPYQIPDDFYGHEELAGCEDAYYESQLAWFEEFDRYLSRFISYAQVHSIGFAGAHYLRLKYLADDMVIRAKIMNRILESLAPSEIRFFRKPLEASPRFSIFEFESETRSTFAHVLEACAKKSGIKLSTEILGEVRKPAAAQAKTKSGAGRSLLRSLYHFFFYQKYLSFFGDGPLKGKKVLLHEAGSHPVNDAIRRLLRQKAEIYLEREDRSWEIMNSLFEKRTGLKENSVSVSEQIRTECREAADHLGSSELFSFYDQECGFKTAPLLLPYLREFVAHVIPETIRQIEVHQQLLKEQDLNAVLTIANASPQTSGSLLAAKLSGVPRICLQHGFSVCDFKILYKTEMDTFDYTVVHDEATRDHFEGARDAYGIPCEVEVSPEYFEALRKEGRPDLSGAGKRVLYYCTKMGPGIRCLNTMTHFFTWYFEYLKAVIDFMGAHPLFSFTFKFSDHQEWGEKSILPYIAQKNFPNIRVEKKLFIKCLSQADRVIVDYPSTGSFEAAAAGIPMLALCRRAYQVQPRAAEVFAPALRRFSGIPEAVAHMNDFLASNPRLFKVNLPLGTPEPGLFARMISGGVRTHAL